MKNVFSKLRLKLKIASPSVREVAISLLDPEAEFPTFEGYGKYVGGKEGDSIFFWQRLRNETNLLENIEGYNMQYYTTTEKDSNCQIRFGYQPVRIDGAIGNLVFSDFSSPIHSAPPKIANFSIQGNLIEGETITFYANFKNCEQDNCQFTW